MMAVQVAEFGAVEYLAASQITAPAAGAGEVLIEVAAAGVNFPDVMVAEGGYQTLPPRPFILGKEASGRVVHKGEGVDRFAIGDRVLALVEFGAFAEYIAVPQEHVIRLPGRLPFEKAAALGMVYSTAHLALVRRARLQPGETVLITGAGGGVGSAGVQIAKALGATLIALAADEEKAQLARSHGADRVIVAGAANLREELSAATGGQGVDVVLDTVGGDVFSQAVRATAWEGRVVIVGFASGSQNPIKPGHLLVKNISVMGLQSSDYQRRAPEEMHRVFEDLFGWLESGAIDVPLDGRYPLDSVSAALRRMRESDVRGKLILTIGAEHTAP